MEANLKKEISKIKAENQKQTEKISEKEKIIMELENRKNLLETEYNAKIASENKDKS